MRDMLDILHRFDGLRVVVVGDAMLDRYLTGTATRLCREGPVPVVRVSGRTDCPGGGANTTLNVRGLGASVCLVSVLGADEAGESLTAALHACGVGTEGVVVDAARRTLALQRVRAGGQLLVRLDDGSSGPPSSATEAELLRRIDSLVPTADAVVVSDYGHGVLTEAVIDRLAALQASHPRVLVVDSKHPAAFRRLRPTAVKPNWSEALALLGSGELDGTSERADGIAVHGDRVLELTGAEIAAVTLDSEGAIVFERGRPPHRTFTRSAPDSRAAGAGDTFVAAFTLALAAGADTPAAAELASAAAAVVVSRDETAPCTAFDLEAHLAGSGKLIRDAEHLLRLVREHREQGRRLVFTNGCFDLLHRGHITYLNRAKTLADVLIVGINSDGSVRQLKGPDRPINPLDDRAQVLGALSCVDHVVPFEETTPARLLEQIRPDIYVKGGDYTLDTLPEAPVIERLGARVLFLPFMQDRSTTAIIDRITRQERATR